MQFTWRSLGALVLLLSPCAASGQRIAGFVRDAATGEIIASALVQLVKADSTVAATTFTDVGGSFSFPIADAPAGGYIYAGRLGYRTLRVTFRELPLDLTHLTLDLERDPVQLAPIAATVPRSRELEQNGFYNRRKLGFGKFITRDMLEQQLQTATRVDEVLRTVPGILRVDAVDNDAVVYVQGSANFNGPCPALIYLDGHNEGKVLPRMSPTDVEAIEVYRGAAEVPAQYGGANSACGVILIWTRTGAGG